MQGIIVEVGSPFDHLGILAREMNIPVIYNVKYDGLGNTVKISPSSFIGRRAFLE